MLSDDASGTSPQQVAAELRALLDAAVDGIIVIDRHGVIAEFNKSAERLFGYRADEVLGQPVKLLMPEPYQSEHDGYLTHYLETGEPRIIGIGREVEALRADGTVFPIALSVGEIEGGRGRRFIGLIRDLTAKKAAQAETYLLQNRLAQVGRLNLMGEMAAGLAHELNQPLSAIANYAQAGRRFAKRDVANADSITDCYAKIAEQALRAGDIIARLRDFLSKHEVNKIRLSLNEVVASTLRLVEADARAVGIPIKTEFADGLPPIRGDSIQLQQVVMNLTRNAIDAMQDRSDRSTGVLICTRLLPDREVEACVHDRGPGVPAHLAATIFDPFVTTKPDGLGVGLAISRTIVRAHDGELFCRANPAGGATFGFKLPAVEIED